MSYTPRRTAQFYYIEDLIRHVEQRQCHNCAHRGPDPSMPMCLEATGPALIEEPVGFWDEAKNGRVVCRRWEKERPQGYACLVCGRHDTCPECRHHNRLPGWYEPQLPLGE